MSPTINSFTPTTGSGGTIVVISGANFSGTTDVKFNGTSAASFNVDSDAQITAVAPAGVTTGPISVTNAGGTTTSVTNFTLSLIKLSTFEANGGALTDPSTGVTSTSGTGLSVETVSPLKGSFSARANGGSSYLQDTFTGKDDVYASFYLRLNALPAAGVRIAMFLDGSTTVGNFNLTTTGALTLRNGTTAIGANSAPLAIGQVYHVALHQKKGTGANAVLEGFLAVGDAAFGVPFASSSTGTWIDQATSFRLGATIATAVDLVVDNIQIDTTLPFSAPAPSITGFNPTSGTVGTSVTISGTNFGATQSGGSVKFNGVTAVPTTWSTSSIVATVPASATTGPITVITAGGTASTINLATPNFTVNGATPNITDFTPASGPVGTQITINGSNLSGATSVTVNGTAVQSIDSNTAVQIKVTVASATTGSGPIVVNTPGGQATSATNFTVAAAPTVTSFTPTAGLTGASVVISGTGFTGASAVKFNGTSATTFTVDSDIQITVTVPGSATSGLVSVTTSNGTGTSANPFTVGAPTVTELHSVGRSGNNFSHHHRYKLRLSPRLQCGEVQRNHGGRRHKLERHFHYRAGSRRRNDRNGLGDYLGRYGNQCEQLYSWCCTGSKQFHSGGRARRHFGDDYWNWLRCLARRDDCKVQHDNRYGADCLGRHIHHYPRSCRRDHWNNFGYHSHWNRNQCQQLHRRCSADGYEL